MWDSPSFVGHKSLVLGANCRHVIECDITANTDTLSLVARASRVKSHISCV